jgi:hypothetical protein
MDALVMLVTLAGLSVAVAELASHLPTETRSVLPRARKKEAQ